jgi:hypothetical protein
MRRVMLYLWLVTLMSLLLLLYAHQIHASVAA